MVWSVNSIADNAPPNFPFHDTAPTGESAAEVMDVHPISEPGDVVNSHSGGRPVEDNEQGVDSNQQPNGQAEPVEPVPVRKAKLQKRPSTLDHPTSSPRTARTIDIDLQSGITIRPKPGKTESVVIARSKLNRVLTPYAEPKVLTVDNMETKIDGSAIYIATDSEFPVGLFITDGESGNATSLQLSPQELVAPVEIRIEQDVATKNSTSDNPLSRSDDAVHQDSPYLTEIKTIFQALGKQQIPSGFTLEALPDDRSQASLCHGTNLTFKPGQLLSGHDSRIIVMVAQNRGLSATLLEEAFCANDEVMAVAAWPRVRLEPGEKTEVFVLMRLPASTEGAEARPGLL
ncbi:MAG: type-F conjugative transfer system secretin TraK [Methylovulum sp.]|nr:type-F conjugative transfer system secretin TraK [Methylovulum sp.]